MTPRAALEPFIQRLKKREREIEHRTMTVSTTPEEHGEQCACINTVFELSIRLRKQDNYDIAPHWEQAFVDYLRKPSTEEPHTPGDLAWNQFDCQFANELEQIFKQHGSIK